MADDSREQVAGKVIFVNIGLIALKAAVALLTGSIAIIASLVDSLFDLFGSGLAYFSVKKAAAPADEDHHYGHKKIENLGSLAQLALITAAAIGICWEAVNRLGKPVVLGIEPIELAVIVGVVVVDVFLALYLRKQSKKHKSTALEASAANYTSDILQNSVAFLGMALAFWGWGFADPIAAIILSLFMLRVVYKVGTKAVNELLDVSPPQKDVVKISEAIKSFKKIKSFHRLRARSIEGNYYLDLHIQMNPKMSLHEAHAVSHALKAKIMKKVPEVCDVVIHLEPYEKGDELIR